MRDDCLLVTWSISQSTNQSVNNDKRLGSVWHQRILGHGNVCGSAPSLTIKLHIIKEPGFIFQTCLECERRCLV